MVPTAFAPIYAEYGETERAFVKRAKEHYAARSGVSRSRKGKKAELDHFRWLAIRMFLLHDATDAEITEWLNKTERLHKEVSAVRKGIDNAARALGIRLPARAPGPKRKLLRRDTEK